MIETRPGRIPDIFFWPGDRLTLRLFFRHQDGNAAVDMSTSEWTAASFTQSLPFLTPPTIDTEDADAGIVRLQFTDAQTAALPVYSQYTVNESGRWGRTILLGRLVSSRQVGTQKNLLPVLEDGEELLVPVLIVDSTINDGATWDSMGAIIWDNTGTITWDNI